MSEVVTAEQTQQTQQAHAAASTRLNTAIVIGAGYAGLLTARVLVNRFDRVLVVERGALPLDADYRKTVPQAHHHHVMLRRGQLALEKWFPGFEKALDEFAAPHLDYGRDVQLFASDGVLPRFRSDISLRPVRRPVIDHLLYRFVAKHQNISFMAHTKVLGLEHDSVRSRVVGIRVEHSKGHEVVNGHLVVDCSGRGTQLPNWLAQLGYSAPSEARVDAGISYASQLFRLQDSGSHDLESIRQYCMDVAAKPPHQPRALGLWPVDQGLWQLTCITMDGHTAPASSHELDAFLESLDKVQLRNFVQNAEPVTELKRHKGTAGVWRKYHQSALPSGLLVVGDANCCFNPLHGQGMSVVANVCEVLEKHLLTDSKSDSSPYFGQHSDPYSGLYSDKHSDQYDAAWCQRFLKASSRVYWQAWSISLTEDLRWSSATHQGLTGVPLLKAAHRFIDYLISRGRRQPKIIQRCLDVTNMMRHPSALASPAMWRDVVVSYFKSEPIKSDPIKLEPGNAFLASGEHPEVQSWIMQYGSQSSSYFGYQKDCQFFVDRELGCIPFASRKVLGRTVNVTPTSPYAHPSNIAALAQSLESFTGNPVLFLGITKQACAALRAEGYAFSQLGREFQIPIRDFEVAGKKMKYLRWVANFSHRGFEVKEQTWADIDQQRVNDISAVWRKSKRFSYRELAMLTRPPKFEDEWKVRKFFCYFEGKLVGYVFFDPYFDQGKVVGYCANILRSDPSIRPHGFLDFVILEAIQKFRAEGVQSISLGMAPLYGVESEPGDVPAVRGLAQLIYSKGAFLYAFKDLAYHKQRYRMIESPWYICYRGLSLPQVSFATARACRVV